MEDKPLTVAELIEILSTFDQTLPVYCYDLDTWSEIPINRETDGNYPSVYLSSNKTRLLIEAAGY